MNEEETQEALGLCVRPCNLTPSNTVYQKSSGGSRVSIFDICRRRRRSAVSTQDTQHRACSWLTMKFGKDLEQYKHPEWEDEYMNYQMLKDILRKLESQAKVRLDCDCPT